jgi:hypothetical protein
MGKPLPPVNGRESAHKMPETMVCRQAVISNSSERSAAGAEWVRHPSETASTPVAATASILARVIPRRLQPGLPLVRRTQRRMASTPMLASRIHFRARGQRVDQFILAFNFDLNHQLWKPGPRRANRVRQGPRRTGRP